MYHDHNIVTTQFVSLSKHKHTTPRDTGASDVKLATIELSYIFRNVTAADYPSFHRSPPTGICDNAHTENMLYVDFTML